MRDTSGYFDCYNKLRQAYADGITLDDYKRIYCMNQADIRECYRDKGTITLNDVTDLAAMNYLEYSLCVQRLKGMI